MEISIKIFLELRSRRAFPWKWSFLIVFSWLSCSFLIVFSSLSYITQPTGSAQVVSPHKVSAKIMSNLNYKLRSKNKTPRPLVLKWFGATWVDCTLRWIFLAGQTKPHWSILNFRFQRPSFLKVPPRAPQFQCWWWASGIWILFCDAGCAPTQHWDSGGPGGSCDHQSKVKYWPKL